MLEQARGTWVSDAGYHEDRVSETYCVAGQVLWSHGQTGFFPRLVALMLANPCPHTRRKRVLSPCCNSENVRG